MSSLALSRISIGRSANLGSIARTVGGVAQAIAIMSTVRKRCTVTSPPLSMSMIARQEDPLRRRANSAKARGLATQAHRRRPLRPGLI